MVASIEEIRSFATDSVRVSLAERYSAGEFSRDLWRSMGELGLLGLTVPARYGGSGGTAFDLANAMCEFTRAGCDLGLTLSWITHLCLCAKSIEEFGTEEQKMGYLPRLASGELVGAAAVSEPKTGAHPAGIKTTAVETATGFRLDGQKIYITDGPVADLLLVMAATGVVEERNELTMFLVESKTPGFRAKWMDLNFVMTAPHGEIKFEGVELDADAMLGKRGEAHSGYSRAAFARERSLVVSAFPGLFEAAAGEVAGRLEKREGAFELEGSQAYSWIHHMSALEGYRKLSAGLAEAAFADQVRWRESIDVLIYLGISYAKWGTWIEEFASLRHVRPGFPLDIMLNDMKLVIVGEGLLIKEGRRRFIPESSPE